MSKVWRKIINGLVEVAFESERNKRVGKMINWLIETVIKLKIFK